MKRRPFLIISIILTGCLLLANCKKNKVIPADNPYGLPNATQTGADVFAFRENGINVIYKENRYSYKYGRYKNDTTVVGIYINPDSPQPNIHILSFVLYGDITSSKTYNLEDSTQVSCYYSYGGTALCMVNYDIPFYPKAGTITFTKIDPINKILSGNFDNIKIPINDCNGIDTLKITYGRFDLYYYDNFLSTQ